MNTQLKTSKITLDRESIDYFIEHFPCSGLHGEYDLRVDLDALDATNGDLLHVERVVNDVPIDQDQEWLQGVDGVALSALITDIRIKEGVCCD